MFDVGALELIGNAPHFGDIELSNLSKELTRGYTEIVSARLAYKESLGDDEELLLLLEKVKRIASTYEAYVFLLNNKDDHKAAAFVAASAHQLVFNLKSVISDVARIEPLTDLYIHPQISASLLYFIAGYTADSSEMIGNVNAEEHKDGEQSLLAALKSLLTGELNGFEANQPAYPAEGDWGESAASQVLWAHLHKGVNVLLGSISSSSDQFVSLRQDANSIFEEVKELAQNVDDIEVDEDEVTYRDIYTGQFYLANLLGVISNTLSEISLVNIETPEGVNDQDWRMQLSRIAINRPYLWPNHLEAISHGYLDQGVSSVVSFPTGSGKSTLSELKIATSLMRGEQVIFVVPTLALVDQVSKSLRDAFPTVTTRMSIEAFDIEELEVETLPDILVMTPESLLVRMSFSPDSFESVGLFIFDECHLLHSKSLIDADRRSVDAMLCLLRIIKLSDNVDILLMSAMIENNTELSDWLEELIERQVLALNIQWKPTRQAKGCVVYDSQRTTELNDYIVTAPRTDSGRLTASAKRNLSTIPHSFFSLNQTWHSNRTADYKLAKLSNEEVLLEVNDYGGLTANRNRVAASIAINSISAGIKTLVFAADIKACDSIVKVVDRSSESNFELNDFENQLKELIGVEFGGDYSYLDSGSLSLPHHGLLLNEERQLHESLFRRDSGINLMVATSTLAQGINLPAECVIIAGNTRFDVLENEQQELDAHELLNAAGRAGRAGKNATGVVIVIPGKVVSFDASGNKITRYWREIQEVFSKEDQCLTIEDPLQIVLDKLSDDDSYDSYDVRYFIQRLPVDEFGDCSQFINSTFVAYQARKNNNVEWVTQSIDVANTAFSLIRTNDDLDEVLWHEQLASASGIEPDLIRELGDAYADAARLLTTPIDHVAWLILWLAESIDRLQKFIRIESLERTFKGPFKNLNDEEKELFFKTTIVGLVTLWMNGSTLKDIELAIGTSEAGIGKCNKARSFVLRVIPEIAYSAGILAHISNKLEVDGAPKLEYLGQLTRLGFDKMSKLVLHKVIDSPTSRVNTHNIYLSMEEPLRGIDEDLSFSDLMSSVGRTYREWLRRR